MTTWVVIFAERRQIVAQHVLCGHWVRIRFVGYSRRRFFGPTETACESETPTCTTCRRSVRKLDVLESIVYRG